MRSILAGMLLASCLCSASPKSEWNSNGSDRPTDRLAQADRLDSFVKEKMQARRIPGAAIAVVENGRITFEKAFGLGNLEAEIPVRTTSVFQLASITKQFTATAIMILVEEGKVRLDDSIVAYINSAPESWGKVTVRHLLTHTSGIVPGAIVRVDDQGRLNMRAGTPLIDITAKRTLEVLSREPTLFPPGDRIMYCDVGYFLLGLIIEKASGQSYQDFLQKRVFDVLQMTDSSILDKWRIIKGSVPVYTIRNRQWAPWRRDWQYEVNAFAGVCSTLDDLAKWDAALRGEKLLKKSTLDLMWTPAKLNNEQDALLFGERYGFGWTLGEVRGSRTVEHGGASGTYILRFLDEELTIIVLTNLDVPSGSQPALLAREIAGLIRPQFLMPEMLPSQVDPVPQMTRNIRAMLSEMAEERDSPIMTNAYRTFWNGNPGPLREGDARLLKTLKSFTYLATDDVTTRGLRRMGEEIVSIVYYKGEVDNKAFYFTFWLARDGKVAHLRFNQE